VTTRIPPKTLAAIEAIKATDQPANDPKPALTSQTIVGHVDSIWAGMVEHSYAVQLMHLNPDIQQQLLHPQSPAPDLAGLCKRAHMTAIAKGFHDMERPFAVDCMLMVTELAEAVEGDRHGDIPNRTEELADLFIRLADTCEHYGVDLAAEVLKKMAMNDLRPHRHGGKAY